MNIEKVIEYYKDMCENGKGRITDQICERSSIIINALEEKLARNKFNYPCFCFNCKKGMFKSEKYCSHCGVKVEECEKNEM